MAYAEVAVDSPIAQRHTFSYSIPQNLSISIGQAVWVPFGPKLLQGIVFRLTEYPAVEETRDIADVISPDPLVSPIQIDLAQWLSEYYLVSPFTAAAAMLPPGFERKLDTLLYPTTLALPDSLSPDEKLLLQFLQKRGKTPLRIITRKWGEKRTKRLIKQLLDQCLIGKVQELEKPRIGPKLTTYLSLSIGIDEAKEAVKRLSRRAPKQAELLSFLVDRAPPISLKEVKQETRCLPSTIGSLRKKGMVSTTPVQSWREPQIEPAFLPTMEVERLTLTEAQKTALNKISASLRGEAGPKVFLLHGVTGSGKTEVYLRALEETIASGKRGIVLVPEIALTPQTMERFASRFPHRVAIWHSQLSLGEQLDQWHRIKAGDFDVVLGPRSALFVPQPNLGLIVIDEEHEWTYKQQEQSPYYQAREVALKLTELTGATVILGSATPSVESFYQAQFGRYQLLELPQRITPAGLPEVEVVDMRQELKGGNRSIFSNLLKVKIMNALIAQEQAILFLNRRGTATFIQCRHCGSVLCCPRCDLPLTYHATEEILLCHQCNYRRRVPQVCPECSQRGIKFLGLGTERVAREIGQTFPTARVLRWDRDVTRGKYAHQRILHKFLSREADILIGTQMIAKGLDFPKVALVGIISADTVLHLPDFRAGERTFQLLSQVAGRAGRGDLPGKVIIQTYTPNHYAVQTAANYDYSGLYQHEIKSRQKHNQPPFSQLVCLTYAHYKLANCQRETKRLYARLNQEKEAQELSDIEVMGPFPAFFSRRRGRYRWQIILRGFQPSRLLSSVALPQGWSVDVDPISLL